MGPVISREILDFLSLHYFFSFFFFFMTISLTQGFRLSCRSWSYRGKLLLLSALCQLCPAGLVLGDGGSSRLLALSPLVSWVPAALSGVGEGGELPVTGRGPKD